MNPNESDLSLRQGMNLTPAERLIQSSELFGKTLRRAVITAVEAGNPQQMMLLKEGTKRAFRENQSPDFKLTVLWMGLTKDGKSRVDEGFIDEMEEEFKDIDPSVRPAIVTSETNAGVRASISRRLKQEKDEEKRRALEKQLQIGKMEFYDYLWATATDSEIDDVFYSLPGRYLYVKEVMLHAVTFLPDGRFYGKPRIDLGRIRRRISNKQEFIIVDYQAGEAERRRNLAIWENLRNAEPSQVKEVMKQYNIVTNQSEDEIIDNLSKSNIDLSKQHLEAMALIVNTLIVLEDSEALDLVDSDGKSLKGYSYPELKELFNDDGEVETLDAVRDFLTNRIFRYLFGNRYDTNPRALKIKGVRVADGTQISGSTKIFEEHSLKDVLVKVATRRHRGFDFYDPSLAGKLKDFGWITP